MPRSLRELPVSTFPALGLQVCLYYHVWQSLHEAKDQTQVFMLANIPQTELPFQLPFSDLWKSAVTVEAFGLFVCLFVCLYLGAGYRAQGLIYVEHTPS